MNVGLSSYGGFVFFFYFFPGVYHKTYFLYGKYAITVPILVFSREKHGEVEGFLPLRVYFVLFHLPQEMSD